MMRHSLNLKSIRNQVIQNVNTPRKYKENVIKNNERNARFKPIVAEYRMPSSERMRREEEYENKLVNFFFKKNVEYHRNKDIWKKPQLKELFSMISHDNDLSN